MTSVVPNSLSIPLGAKVCVHICGAGPNLVSLSVEAVDNTGCSPDRLEIPNIDTLRGKVDRTTSSWTIDVNISRITIKLRFPDCQALDAFLFALSYVRLSDFITTRSPSPIPLTERCLTQRDVQRFREMRASVYYRQATIAVLPVELLSEVFLFLLHSADEPPTFGSTLLPLRVCSEWRSVAIGTASLWRTPPTFTLTPSFFLRGGATQAVRWLERAKGRNIDLSITIPTRFSSKIPSLIQSNPSLFAPVQSLTLVCPPSHIQPLLGPAGPILSFLQVLSLQIILPVPGAQPSYGSLELCRSAPLLREASLETDWVSCPRHTFNLLAIFPWAQLTSLSIRMRLEISVWLSMLTGCTSLCTGKFVLFDDDASTYPSGTVTLPDLVSLRLILRRVSNTRFFDHLALPALHQFHVSGRLGGDVNVSFLAKYPALRELVVHLDLLDNGTRNAIHDRLAPLERLSTFEDVPAFPGAGLQQLRDLTILTSTSTSRPALTDRFLTTSARWIAKMVFTSCDFHLYGTEIIVEGFRRALGTARAFEASVTYNYAAEDAFDRYARRGSYVLTVRKV